MNTLDAYSTDEHAAQTQLTSLPVQDKNPGDNIVTLKNRYELRTTIGTGGMGIVWQGFDLVLHREVAVKEVRLPEGMPEAEQAILRERTMREARAAAALNHPAVVQVFDVVEHDDRPWIIMELLRSRSLTDIVRQEGPLEPIAVIDIGLSILGALESAHNIGMLHRDIKPGNVMLNDEGRVTLTDFGVARIGGESPLTSTGLLLGSPQYISPERARGGSFGPASDLWSLGATLYAAVEGKAPFDRSDPVSTMAAVVTEEAPIPVRGGPLAEVIMGLLIKDPDQRWDTERTRRELDRARRDLRNHMPRPQSRRRQKQATSESAAPSMGGASFAASPVSSGPTPSGLAGPAVLTGPGSSGPGSSRPGSSRPGSSRPGSSRPGSSRPGSSGSGSASGAAVSSAPSAQANAPINSTMTDLPAVQPPTTPNNPMMAGQHSPIHYQSNEHFQTPGNHQISGHYQNPGNYQGSNFQTSTKSRKKAVMMVGVAVAFIALSALLAYFIGSLVSEPPSSSSNAAGKNATASPSNSVALSSAAPIAGFTAAHPVDWKKNEYNDNRVRYYKDKTFIQYNVEKVSTSDQKVVWKGAENWVQNGQTEIRDYALVGFEAARMGNHNAVSWEWTSSRNGDAWHGMEYGVVLDGKSYQLYLSAPEQTYKTYLPTLQAIAATFSV